MQGVKSLRYSRKFWLAVVAIIQAIVFHYLPGFPPDLWQAIAALLGVLIASIALEDAAAKRNNPLAQRSDAAEKHALPPPSRGGLRGGQGDNP